MPKILKFCLSMISIAIVSCQTSPTGRKQLMLIPSEQVDAMGTQAFAEMKSKEPLERDSAINTYVKCIADAITAAHGEGAWEVVVFKSDQVNAFALPGGKIGVYTGLLKIAQTPAQLAAVLGHEVGHVTAEHGRERVSQQQLTGIGLEAVSMIFKDRGSGTYKAVMAGLGLGTQIGVVLPFGRLQESEADLIGLELMARAGFDPRHSVDLWLNMSKAAGGSAPPQILSTHPSHESRIENLQERMPEAMRTFAASERKPDCRR